MDQTKTPTDPAASNILFQTLIGTAVDGIMVIDATGTVRIYNPACEKLFGYVKDEVVGQNISMLMPPATRREHDSYLSHYMTTGEKRIIGIGREVVGQRRDGTTFPMYLSVGDGSVGDQRVFVGIVHDISERQSHDRRIRELQQELLHVTRLTAMGQMTSALAHELNQPLTAVSNYANAARRTLEGASSPQAETARNMLEKAAGQITRAGEIIRRLREFIEKREPNHTLEDVNRIVADAAALALLGAEQANIKLDLRLAPGLPQLAMDRIQIEQVAVNLLRNAAEAMEDSAKRELTVTTSLYERDYVKIAVSDTGCGVSEVVLQRLFQPFVTTKDRGMGMGLSICRSIIDAHGGRIWATPREGGGSVFQFILPFAPAKPPQ
jgi:two-component system sensor kinase FixL